MSFFRKCFKCINSRKHKDLDANIKATDGMTEDSKRPLDTDQANLNNNFFSSSSQQDVSSNHTILVWNDDYYHRRQLSKFESDLTWRNDSIGNVDCRCEPFWETFAKGIILQQLKKVHHYSGEEADLGLYYAQFPNFEIRNILPESQNFQDMPGKDNCEPGDARTIKKALSISLNSHELKAKINPANFIVHNPLNKKTEISFKKINQSAKELAKNITELHMYVQNLDNKKWYQVRTIMKTQPESKVIQRPSF